MNRVIKYDILRVFASFAIVLLHVSASYWSVVDVNSKEFLVMTVYNSMTRFAVPVFFMLSGLFLVSPHRGNDRVGRRILKLIVLFYIWSVFYAFQGIAIDALMGDFSEEVWRGSLERFIFGHPHMWFLQTLAGFYLLIPVARQICAKKESVQYYLLLWAVFRFLFPSVTGIFHLPTLQARIDSLHMDTLAGTFGYFLLGYYLDATDISKKIRRMIYLLGIGAVCMTAFLTVYDCRGSGLYVEDWFSPGSPNILVMSVAVFVCFKYCNLFERIQRRDKWIKLSGCTFFVYMFHMFIIEKLNLIGITTVAFPAVISIPVLTVFTFGVSLVCAIVADHIPVIRKIVMLH